MKLHLNTSLRHLIVGATFAPLSVADYVLAVGSFWEYSGGNQTYTTYNTDVCHGAIMNGNSLRQENASVGGGNIYADENKTCELYMWSNSSIYARGDIFVHDGSNTYDKIYLHWNGSDSVKSEYAQVCFEEIEGQGQAGTLDIYAGKDITIYNYFHGNGTYKFSGTSETALTIGNQWASDNTCGAFDANVQEKISITKKLTASDYITATSATISMGALSAGNAVNLTATNSLSTGSISSSSSSVTLKSSSSTVTTDGISAKNDVKLTSKSDLKTGSITSSSGSIYLNRTSSSWESSNGKITTGALSAGSSIYLHSYYSIVAGNCSAGSTIEISSDSSVSTGTLSAKTITINGSSGGVTVGTMTATTINFNRSGNSFTSGNVIIADGTISVQASSANLGGIKREGTGDSGDSNGVDISVSGALSVGTYDNTHSVYCDARSISLVSTGGSLTASYRIHTAHSLTATSGGDLSIGKSTDGSVRADKGVTISSSSGKVTLSGSVGTYGTGSISISASHGISIGQNRDTLSTSTTNSLRSTSGSITVSSTSANSGNYNIDISGATLADAGSVNINGADKVTLNSAGTQNIAVKGKNDVTLSAGNTMTVSGTVTSTSGKVTVSGTSLSATKAVQGYTAVSLSSSSGDMSVTDVTSDSSTVTLSSSSKLTATGTIKASQNVTGTTSTGYMTIANATSDKGSISFTAGTGSSVSDAGMKISGTLTAAQGISLKSNSSSKALTVDGTLSSGTGQISLSSAYKIDVANALGSSTGAYNLTLNGNNTANLNGGLSSKYAITATDDGSGTLKIKLVDGGSGHADATTKYDCMLTAKNKDVTISENTHVWGDVIYKVKSLSLGTNSGGYSAESKNGSMTLSASGSVSSSGSIEALQGTIDIDAASFSLSGGHLTAKSISIDTTGNITASGRDFSATDGTLHLAATSGSATVNALSGSTLTMSTSGAVTAGVVQADTATVDVGGSLTVTSLEGKSADNLSGTVQAAGDVLVKGAVKGSSAELVSTKGNVTISGTLSGSDNLVRSEKTGTSSVYLNDITGSGHTIRTVVSSGSEATNIRTAAISATDCTMRAGGTITVDGNITGSGNDLLSSNASIVVNGNITAGKTQLHAKKDITVTGALGGDGNILRAEGNLTIEGRLEGSGNQLTALGTYSDSGTYLSGGVVTLKSTEAAVCDYSAIKAHSVTVSGALTANALEFSSDRDGTAATITVDGSLTLAQDSTVDGNVSVSGALKLSDHSSISGTVTMTGSSASLEMEHADLSGSVSGASDVTLTYANMGSIGMSGALTSTRSTFSLAEGNTLSTASIKRSTATGDLSATGDVSITDNSTLTGSVTTGGALTLKNGATVTKDVSAASATFSGTVSMASATVTGTADVSGTTTVAGNMKSDILTLKGSSSLTVGGELKLTSRGNLYSGTVTQASSVTALILGMEEAELTSNTLSFEILHMIGGSSCLTVNDKMTVSYHDASGETKLAGSGDSTIKKLRATDGTRISITGSGTLSMGGVTFARGSEDGSITAYTTADNTTYSLASSDFTLRHLSLTLSEFPSSIGNRLVDCSLSFETQASQLTLGSLDMSSGANSISQVETVNLTDSLTLGSGSELTLSTDAETHSDANTADLCMQDGSTLTVSGAATLNANLVLGSGSTLNSAATLAMGCAVTIDKGVTLDGTLATGLGYGQTATLFTGVDSLVIDGVTYADGSTLAAAEVFTGSAAQLQNYQLAFNGGNVTLTLTPEPATTTLSLLALAALASRRRRLR